MPAMTLANLALYAAQAALLIGALALTLVALRPGPAFRLAACRVLLAAILLLPLQVWLREAPTALNLLEAPAAGPALAVGGMDAQGNRQVPWGAIAGGVLAAGVALRMLWLAVGLARIRRLAGSVSWAGEDAAVAINGEVSELQTELGTNARVAFVDRVKHPMTFGIAPAVVLLPASLLAASPDRRRAVLCHELWHVRRRDWLWVLGEELALTVLWFHPAVWWLVGELQLAREQVVDQLTVAATGARREYMDALFSAADLPSAPPLLSGFLRRRHLARRLVSLAEEVDMSRMRLVAGAVVVAVVLVGSGLVGVAAWPLAQQAQDVFAYKPTNEHAVKSEIVDALKQKIESIGSVRVVHRTDIEFPAVAADAAFVETVVDVDAAVDHSGEVTSTQATTVTVHGGGSPRGNPSLAGFEPAVQATVTAALDAIRAWRFEEPAQTPAVVRVRARFATATRRASVVGIRAVSGFTPTPVLRVGGAIKPPKKLVNVAPVYPQEAQDAGIQGIVILDAIIAEDGSVKEVEVVRSIPELDGAAIDAVKQWRFEPTLMNGVAVPIKCTTTVNFTLGP
jgi:TonB family protein